MQRRACSSLIQEIVMGFHKRILIRRHSSAVEVLTTSSQRVIVAFSISEAQTGITGCGCNESFLVYIGATRSDEWILNFLHLFLQLMSEYPRRSTPRWVRLWGMSSQDICSAPWHVEVEHVNMKTPLAGVTRSKPLKDSTPHGKLF